MHRLKRCRILLLHLTNFVDGFGYSSLSKKKRKRIDKSSTIGFAIKEIKEFKYLGSLKMERWKMKDEVKTIDGWKISVV